MIEKIIFQTWKTKNVPEPYKSYVESVRSNNPGYEYRLLTDKDNRRFIENRYPWFLHTFDSYKHAIERADAVRYFLLYTYGGVYIDLDMECIKSIDDLLTDGELFLSIEAGPLIRNQVVSNAFMASVKGSPFFHHIVKNLEKNKKQDITFKDVFNSTGPDMITREYYKNRNRFDFNIVGLNDICPIRVMDQHPVLKWYSLNDIRKHKKLFFIHHCSNSWNIQSKCPNRPIEGYVLYKSYDIAGYDIDYVEYVENDHSAILDVCSANSKAVGFNYNGFVKGPGGKLQKIANGGDWYKDGVVPWIYVKKDKLASLL